MVGSAIVRALKKNGYSDILTASHSDLDLRNQASVTKFFSENKPNAVILAAARVGGINANNKYRADFIYDNLQIESNVIHAAFEHECRKLIFLGSSCIYPREAKQPIKEEYLLTSELEYTNEPYAIAKIAGMKMCEAFNIQYGTNFLSVMPCNLYGPNDNYDLFNSHVIPAMIRKMTLAKLLLNGEIDLIKRNLGLGSESEVMRLLEEVGIRKGALHLWGSGKPLREFLHVDDLADGVIYVYENIDFKDLIQDPSQIINTHINIGYGEDLSIRELAEKIRKLVGFSGELIFNPQMPDGTYRKLMDISKIRSYGWSPKIDLEKGLSSVINEYWERGFQ